MQATFGISLSEQAMADLISYLTGETSHAEQMGQRLSTSVKRFFSTELAEPAHPAGSFFASVSPERLPRATPRREYGLVAH